MYIDFPDSIVDTPFKGVSEEVFKAFSVAENIDEFYEKKIKDVFEKIIINTENQIDCNL